MARTTADEMITVLDQRAYMSFHSASSLKQQSADRHDAPTGHIILIPKQLVLLFIVARLAKKQQISL